jgi:hypothetical protein
MDYLQKALSYFNTDKPQWYGWKKDWTGEHRMSYENIIVHDSSITKPTEAEIDAKIQELKDAEQTAINKKASGKQKLKDLGLDDDEIQALIGV